MRSRPMLNVITKRTNRHYYFCVLVALSFLFPCFISVLFFFEFTFLWVYGLHLCVWTKKNMIYFSYRNDITVNSDNANFYIPAFYCCAWHRRKNEAICWLTRGVMIKWLELIPVIVANRSCVSSSSRCT